MVAFNSPHLSLHAESKTYLLNRRGTNRRIFDVCAKNAIGAKQLQLGRRTWSCSIPLGSLFTLKLAQGLHCLIQALLRYQWLSNADKSQPSYLLYPKFSPVRIHFF